MSKRDSKSSVSDAVFPPICKYMCVCWPPRPRLQVHRSPVHLSPLTKEQELSETTIGSIIRVRSLRFCLDFVVVIAREDKREHGREGGREGKMERGAWGMEMRVHCGSPRTQRPGVLRLRYHRDLDPQLVVRSVLSDDHVSHHRRSSCARSGNAMARREGRVCR